MVHYSVDTNPRPAILFGLAVVAVGLSVALGSLTTLAAGRAAVPSAFSLFALATFAFDKALWRWPGFRVLAGVPNVGGKYHGTIERGEEGASDFESFPAVVTITQTWTKIDVVVETSRTVSHLRTCGFFIENADRPSILYTYEVRALKPNTGTNFYGEGMHELYFSSAGSSLLSGPYCSTKGNRGFMRLEKVPPPAKP